MSLICLIYTICVHRLGLNQGDPWLITQGCVVKTDQRLCMWYHHITTITIQLQYLPYIFKQYHPHIWVTEWAIYGTIHTSTIRVGHSIPLVHLKIQTLSWWLDHYITLLPRCTIFLLDNNLKFSHFDKCTDLAGLKRRHSKKTNPPCYK